MVYGDSFIKAEFSQLDKTFAKRLEAKLGAIIQIPAEAINAGIVGYGPDQILLKMEEELPRLKPDLTIEAVFADNDFGDLLWHKLFKLGDDDRAIPNRFHIADSLRADFRYARYGPHLLKVGGQI